MSKENNYNNGGSNDHIKGKNSSNAFTFMMMNRHKQNEALNNFSESQTGESSEEHDSDTDASVCSVEEAQKEKTSVLDSIHVPVLENGKNAFNYLMLNRQKFNSLESEEYLNDDLCPNRKRKDKANIKFKFNSPKVSNNLNDSIEFFEIKSDDEESETKSKKFVEKIMISPSDLKSKLINENDKIDIEETFKEEIQECFSKQKKKKKYSHKKKFKKDLMDTSKENFINGSGSDDEIFIKPESKLCKGNTNQLDIKSFFKASVNSEKKPSSKNNIQNVNFLKNNNLQNSHIKSSNNLEKVSANVKKNEDNEEIKCFKNRATCLKQKTKLLREIRIQHSEKKCENDVKSSEHFIESTIRENENLQSLSDNMEPDSSEKLVSSTANKLESSETIVSNTKNIKLDSTDTLVPNVENIKDSSSILVSQTDKSILDSSDTTEIITESKKLDSSLLDFASNEKLSIEPDPEFVPNTDGTKLRRSARKVKKPKAFEIFETPPKIKHMVSNNDLIEKTSSKSKNKYKKCKEASSNIESTQLKISTSRKSSRKNKGEKTVVKEKWDSPVVQNVPLDESDPDIIIIKDSPEFKGKATQLAPIFMKKKKIEISPTKLQARKDFFFSDVSETMKKASVKNVEEQNLICPFPKFSHVRQCKESEPLWELNTPQGLSLKEEKDFKPNFSWEHFSSFSKISSVQLNKSEKHSSFPLIDEATICHCLAYYKSKFKEFPVLSIFKSFLDSKKDFINYYERELIKETQKLDCQEVAYDKRGKRVTVNNPGKKLKRKRNTKSLSRNKKRRILDESCDYEIVPDDVWHKWIPYEWTEVFSPKSAEFVVGNLGQITKLKEFLTKWKSAFRKDDASDYVSVSSMSDDSSDNGYDSSVINAVFVSGPPGIGKTASVYALAQDLGYKVLEINASSSRQGKQLMSQLSEATQSHNVTIVSSSHSSLLGYSNQSLDDSIEPTEKGKSMSLILIEDIDIVFEDSDEGFCNAVNTLLCTSKRPIIFTTSIDVANPIPKIKEKYEEIIFELPSLEQIAQYLQVMCLANGVFTNSKEMELLVKSNKNDIRKCILDLHFWVMSDKCSVDYWQISKESNFASILSEKKENDVSLLEIFPEASKFSSKCVKIPISAGSIWAKEDAKFLNAPNCLGERSKSLNWALTSANCGNLLPFTKTEKTKQFKYPLKKDDPDLKRHSLWQKHSWLSLDSDSDTEKETPSSNSKEEEEEEKKTLPKKLRHHLDTCTNSLSKFFLFFTNFDILSSRSYLSHKYYFHDFHHNWWTPSIVDGLETDITSSFSCHYHDNINSVLIPELSHLSLKYIAQIISNIISSKNELTSSEILLLLNLETSNNSSIMEPHCRISMSDYNKAEKLNHLLNSELPSFNQLNRKSAVVDYIPYLREIARSDHIGEAIQKYKRSRRFIKHFNNLEIYCLSSAELINLCNVFNSNLQ